MISPNGLAAQLLRLAAYPEFAALSVYAGEYTDELRRELEEARGPEAHELLLRWQAATRFLKDVGMIQEIKEINDARTDERTEL